MCLLFETIKLKDGVFANLDLHLKRMNDARKALLNSETEISLKSLLTVPDNCKTGIFKCRVDYDYCIHKIEFGSYKARKIKTLQIVHDDHINYTYKFCDRSRFEQLTSKINADDILIVKNGLITDTSFSNIIFYDGKKWVTSDSPLLHGTKRQELIQKGVIYEKRIRLNDLKKFSKARLINAMLDMNDGAGIEMQNIFY
jgi:4-amino-4-deoxychorismate lyase